MTSRVIFANLSVRLRTFSREHSAMFFTFAFPVILVLVFGMIFTARVDIRHELHVQDRAQNAASAQLVEQLRASTLFTISVAPRDADVGQYAREQSIPLMLVIPESFELDINGAAVLEVAYVHDRAMAPETTEVDRDRLLAGVLLEMESRIAEMITAMDSPVPVRFERPRRDRFLEFFVPGIIGMAVMTASLYGTLHISAELRQKGIMRKLATTPITHGEWLISNILYQAVLAAISTAAILLAAYLAFGVTLHLNLWLVAFLLLTVAAFVGLGLMLAPLAREAETASAAGNAILFPMMFLSGTFFPVELMPQALQWIAWVLPLFYINEGLRAGMIMADHGAALQNALIAGGFALAVFVVGLFATRWDDAA